MIEVKGMLAVTIKVLGVASNKELLEINPNENELNMNLMNFLRAHNIPIASSCYGEGVCRKCVINKNILSCQLSVKEFINKKNQVIEITYL